MSQTTPKSLDNTKPKKKLTPELQSLRDEIKTDTHELIEPLKASLDILLQIKNAREEGLKECQAVKSKNIELQFCVERVEQENRCLNTKIHQLEDKLLKGNIIFQGYLNNYGNHQKPLKKKC